MKHIVIVQGSLRPESRTALVAAETKKRLEAKGAKVTLLDLREEKLEWCNGSNADQYSAETQEHEELIKSADGIIFGMPVYCYSVSGVLKNFIDLHSRALDYKVAGILATAGGEKSYIASADLIKILSYECHTLTVQPTVYSWSGDYDGEKITNGKVLEKLDKMIETLLERV